ncbi:hypothetical protein QTN47_17050 [Danxiaibacter flavus]|uniref:Uncharacterized protein n=1 Tax=Danxiaibacter flavus TaxID=3049108 RepID=A0ABV3ZI98_9BACT|nr:hypothetical protein QNM32_17060 [Chitinophagaceae bacterium DXS]
MAILLKKVSSKVMDLIYDKQLSLKKEKKKIVSLEKTVEILLTEAYLNKS